MKSCKQLIILLKSKQVDVKEGMRQMYKDTKLQKVAKINFIRFTAIKTICTWEDIFLEAINRFVIQVKAGKDIKNCNAYFNKICYNYCQELVRSLRIPDGSLDNNSKLDQLFLAIKPFIDQLGNQCQLLMSLLYFHHPPMNPKNRIEIVSILKEHGYSIAESSISATITRCKAKLKTTIGNQLDDFDEICNY